MFHYASWSLHFYHLQQIHLPRSQLALGKLIKQFLHLRNSTMSWQYEASSLILVLMLKSQNAASVKNFTVEQGAL